MDKDAYSKRTDKIVSILEADARLFDGMGSDFVHVAKGMPSERLFTTAGAHVFVHWDSSPTIAMRGWHGGTAQEHIASYRIWWVCVDYTSEEDAETLFEQLGANLLRIIADSVQVADHWRALEIVSGGSTVMSPTEETYWRVGGWTLTMKFQEEV